MSWEYADYDDDQDELKDMKSKTKSDEEIKKVSIDEHLNTSQKLLHIIDKGMSEQIESIMTHLDFHLNEPEINDLVFARITDSLFFLEIDIQKVASETFIRCFNKKQVNVFLIERFQGRLLKLLESPTEESLKIWTPTFLVGLKYSSVNYIEEKILPQALKMIDFSHVSLTRFTGTQIIVQILNLENGYFLRTDLLKTMLDLCQDNDWKIRQLFACRIRYIYIQAKDQKITEAIWKELIELCADEEIQVRLQAVNTVMEIIDQINKLTFAETFLPIFISQLEKSNEESEIFLSNNISLYLCKLETKGLLKEEYFHIINQFVNKLFESHDIQTVRGILDGIPSIANIFKKNNQEFIIHENILRKSNSDDKQILEKVASNFGKLMPNIPSIEGHKYREIFLSLASSKEITIIAPLITDLAPIIKTLLYEPKIYQKVPQKEEIFQKGEESKNKNVLLQPPSTSSEKLRKWSNPIGKEAAKIIVKTDWMKVIPGNNEESKEIKTEGNNEFRIELIQKINKIRKFIIEKNWRVIKCFFENIILIAEYLQDEDFIDNYIQLSLDAMTNGNLIIKESAAKCLVGLLPSIIQKAKRVQTIENVIQNFGKSPNSYCRKVFIYFCVYFCDKFSGNYIEKYILGPLLCLSEDKIANIRISICKFSRNIYPKIAQLGDGEFGRNLLEKLEKLQNDLDKDVQNTAEEALETILDKDFWNYEIKERQMKIDISRGKFEKSFKIREEEYNKQKKEKIKKVIDEQNIIGKVDYTQLLGLVPKKKKYKQSLGGKPSGSITTSKLGLCMERGSTLGGGTIKGNSLQRTTTETWKNAPSVPGLLQSTPLPALKKRHSLDYKKAKRILKTDEILKVMEEKAKIDKKNRKLSNVQ